MKTDIFLWGGASLSALFLSATLGWQTIVVIGEPDWIPPAPEIDGACYKKDAPSYEPWKWNDWKKNGIQGKSNCYAYVANDPVNGPEENPFPQPGQNSVPLSIGGLRHLLSHVFATGGILRDGAATDGMIPLEEGEKVPCGYYLAALTYRPGFLLNDFHWYRLDRDANGSYSWSHKPGEKGVRNTDRSEKRIKDLSAADLLGPASFSPDYHPRFGGYFLVPAGGVDLKPR